MARDLYLRSGNRCAYPGCAQPLMTADGVLVGEIAHIEAAMPDGARFRKTMTNDARRAFDNLLLMCGTHHTVIDHDTATWTVKRLKELKAQHEAVYTGAVDRLRSTVADVTEGTSWTPAANLGRMGETTSLNAVQIAANVAAMNDLVRRLAAVPVGARSVLAVIVIRGDEAYGWPGYRHEVTILIPFLEQVCGCTKAELRDYVAVLEHEGFVEVDAEEGAAPVVNVKISTGDLGWPVIFDLKQLTGSDPAQIRQVLIDLDFTVFDSPLQPEGSD